MHELTKSCVLVGRRNLSMLSIIKERERRKESMPINSFILILLVVVISAIVIYLMIIIVKALKKYISSSKIREEKNDIAKSLGEIIKQHRINCKMTQEFVAESLGVSRQAVSKWETGASNPSTANLIALSKLYGVSAKDILSNIDKEGIR
ncbi:helix-turn-helix domain-containing protein [Guggenheimella bovis]